MSKKSIRFITSLSKNTQRDYKSVIGMYEKFHKMTIDELVGEALVEQTNQVPPHMLKVIDRIEEFQQALLKKNLCRSTIVTHIGKIKKIYKKNRVVLPYLEPLSTKQGRKRDYIEYKDILTKDEIILALSHMTLPNKARTLAMCQGGLSNEECEHLLTSKFINESRKYHECDDDIEALEWLSTHPIIWVSKLLRQKTRKPYYALFSPECVNAFAESLLYYHKLHNELPKKVLYNNKMAFSNMCRKLNDDLGFGRVAEERKFRSHMLRKFHATHIGGSSLSYDEHCILTNAEIDEMQGRGKTATQDTYIKTNPIRQKVLYAKVMNNVCLYHQYDYEIINDDVLVYERNLIDENKKYRDEIQELRKKLENKNKASEKVNALRKELGDDVFKEILQGILNAS